MIKSLTFLKWRLTILLITGIGINSCTKTDSFTSLQEQQTVAHFFKGSENADPLIKRMADTLLKFNKINHFVNDIVKQDGFPVWDKTILETNGKDSVIALPLVLENTRYVNSFLTFKFSGESVSVRLVQGGRYDKYGYDGDIIAMEFMLLNIKTFGSNLFEITNEKVFKIGEIKKKFDKTNLQVKLNIHEVDNKIRARSVRDTGIGNASKKCTGVVYMQNGVMLSSSGDLSCGPTIINTPITGIPITPNRPPTSGPTTPIGGGGGDPSPGKPPVKPILPPIGEDVCPDGIDLQSMTCTITNNSFSTMGTATTSSNGEITAPKNSTGCTYTFNCLWYHPSWNTYYTGIVYKSNIYDQIWKWKKFEFSGFNRSGGRMPPCITAISSSTVSTTIASDKKSAQGIGNVQITFNLDCIYKSDVITFDKSVNDVFYSNN